MRAALLLALLSLSCATHVGVEPGDAREVGRELSRDAVGSGRPSIETVWVLNRLGLADAFEEDPVGVIRQLHAGLESDGELDRLYALSELSYLHAERARDRSYFLSAAVYAYAFLSRLSGEDRVRATDPRSRAAGDLYERGLTRGFETDDGQVVFTEGKVALPFGELDLTLEPRGFRWGGFRLTSFRSAADLSVVGVRNRYRSRGIGAPLLASVAPIEGGASRAEARRVPVGVKVPVTAILALESPRTAIVTGKISGRLSLYAADETEHVSIDGSELPLEIEWTSALADTLSSASFPANDVLIAREDDPDRAPDGLYMLQPHRAGRIPVVLVHGTASRPGAWAELVNELMSDRRIRHRFEFWYFSYRTTSPLAYSGALLRDSLRRAVAELDPKGADPELRRMVVIGHSQGGLLAHLLAVHSGDAFWSGLTSEPFDKVETDPEIREVLRRSLFIEPLPFVSRIIFISTPHHGSYLASWRIDALTPWLVRMPSRVASLAPELMELRLPQGRAKQQMTRVPTGFDNMTPGNRFLETLAALPLAPGVTSHSIIPVRGGEPYEDENDGLVEYKSAHYPPAKSEKVILHCGHAAAGNPLAILEVRRILREHLEAGAAAR